MSSLPWIRSGTARHCERCFGFGSGDFAHCTRQERAGGLLEKPASQTYPHKLVGDYDCGTRHDTSPVPDPASGKWERRQIVATYPYHDEAGEVSYEVVRTEPKGFFQRRPDVTGSVNNLKGTKRLPYRLPQLVAAPKDSTIYVAEGEKDCDRLATSGLVATCNGEGAGKFRPELVRYFEGRNVVIVPDNDEVGRRHAEAVARILSGVAASVRVWQWMEGEVTRGGDISDWLDGDGTLAELLSLVDVLADYEPSETIHTNGVRAVDEVLADPAPGGPPPLEPLPKFLARIDPARDDLGEGLLERGNLYSVAAAFKSGNLFSPAASSLRSRPVENGSGEKL